MFNIMHACFIISSASSDKRAPPKIIENEYLDVTILNSYLANLNLLVDILTKLNNLKLKK